MIWAMTVNDTTSTAVEPSSRTSPVLTRTRVLLLSSHRSANGVRVPASSSR